ncbi:MAG: VOC family protein [Gaiellaceae bacterium]|jgi:hypothetical protein
MQVRRLAWLGIATSEEHAMTAFLKDVLGLKLEFAADATAELSTEEGDRVQVFGPGHEYFDRFSAQASGPVALFEVDDARGARQELEAAGVELVSEVRSDSEWDWFELRGPDGNLYSLASRRL